MKVHVWTQHILTLHVDDDNSMQATVDHDGTVKLDLSCLLPNGMKESRWMDRQDLIALRSLITKSLSLIP